MDIALQYLGWNVEVHYLFYTAGSDRGVLTAIDDRWIVVTRNPGSPREDQLVIPISSIRLLKPLSPEEGPGMRLLRPVEGEEQPREAVEGAPEE